MNKKVITIRNAYQLKSRYHRLRERAHAGRQRTGCTTEGEYQDHHNLGRDGLLKQHRYGSQRHHCLFEPVGNAVLVKGKGGLVRCRRDLPMLNEQDKVQYETYALSRGRRLRAGMIAIE